MEYGSPNESVVQVLTISVSVWNTDDFMVIMASHSLLDIRGSTDYQHDIYLQSHCRCTCIIVVSVKVHVLLCPTHLCSPHWTRCLLS